MPDPTADTPSDHQIKLVRDMWRHEDNLVSNRVTWLPEDKATRQLLRKQTVEPKLASAPEPRSGHGKWKASSSRPGDDSRSVDQPHKG